MRSRVNEHIYPKRAANKRHGQMKQRLVILKVILRAGAPFWAGRMAELPLLILICSHLHLFGSVPEGFINDRFDSYWRYSGRLLLTSQTRLD